MFTQFDNPTADTEIADEQDGTLFFIGEGEGLINLTLPPIIRNGMLFGFTVRDSSGTHRLKVTAPIAFGGSIESQLVCDAFGDTLILISLDDVWTVLSMVGAWTNGA